MEGFRIVNGDAEVGGGGGVYAVGGSELVAAGAYARLVHSTFARNGGADGRAVYVTGSGSSAGFVIMTHAYTGVPGFRFNGYHLGPASAAIGVGLDAGVTTDIDGETRSVGLAPDPGVDDAWRRTFVPVVSRDDGE
jgi:hypothetical protein